jgi:hypothetical protein
MKWLPCEHCKGPAYGGPSKRFPDGEPCVVGRVSHFPHRFRCSRCKRLNVVTAVQWNRMPLLEEDEISRLGIVA